MKVYLAPPKGPSEKVAFIEWLTKYGFQPEVLDGQPIMGPLILAGGADIGKDKNRDIREFRWIQEAIINKQPIIGICRGMQILNHFFGGVVENIDDEIVEAHAAADFSDNKSHATRPSMVDPGTSPEFFARLGRLTGAIIDQPGTRVPGTTRGRAEAVSVNEKDWGSVRALAGL